ncbi:ankyrin repeat protein, partial [Phlyctochytrium arcticum]
LNLPTGTGQTPLHYAVSKRRGGVVETLLSHKDTHPSPQDTYGSTPLHRACALGYAELVKLLIEKGAQMEKEDKEGNTPVLIAVEEGYPAIVQLLV